MKRLLVMLILILLVSSLGACSSNTSTKEPNMIAAAKVNDREDTILATITNESFLFDFSTTENKEIKVWVEKYESGKLVDDEIGSMSTQIDEEGSIVLASAKANNNEKQQTFYLGVGDQSGASSVTILEDKPKDADTMAIVYGELPKAKAINDEEIVLSSIAYSDNEFGTSSISDSFYEDPDSNMDELNEYNVVYLFKAEFTKE